MKSGNVLIALVVGGAIGFVIGKQTNSSSPPAAVAAAVAPRAVPAAAAPSPTPSAPTPNRPVEDASTVYKIPVRDAPVKGPPTAKVTILEFSEFQCPFCARVGPTLKQIQDTYGKDVRIAFKHNPLPFHHDAPLAAEASLAAGEQGKFWEFHDKLFQNQTSLKRENLEQYAQELGLDMGRFRAAIDSGKFKAQVERDKQEAATFGARGTPTFFINGRKLRGAQPFPSFQAIIDEEIAKADAALKSGVKPADLYAHLTRDGLTEGAAPAPQQAPPPQAPPPAKVAEVKDLGDSPSRGPTNAKVTIVGWSEFQCPFCARVKPTIDQILKTYPNEVRFVFKHQPLAFHNRAMPAAIASLAAHQQGKFWEFHDRAFDNQQALTDENFEAWARELKLDLKKFKAALEDPKLKARVEADSKYGSLVGADGTPTFFINGREFVGAQPFEAFKAVIDEELKKANVLLEKGVKPAELYTTILAQNVKSTPKAPEEKPVHIDVGNAPLKGAKNAPVTIVEFSDYECPFCSRVNPTLAQILDKYPGKVRIAFKNQPLSFHANAHLAAQAALAAGEQGKYWEMHDRMFENQRALTRPDLERYAQDLRLDMNKFRSALDNGKFKAQVDDDIALANKVGANGTPTFFVNGRKVVGAQPFEAFAKIIDEELAGK